MPWGEDGGAGGCAGRPGGPEVATQAPSAEWEAFPSHREAYSEHVCAGVTGACINFNKDLHPHGFTQVALPVLLGPSIVEVLWSVPSDQTQALGSSRRTFPRKPPML